ncbi:biosynthetic-type acetolactate synthase large subunit [Limosilactobacillus gastricus]|uniref:Acetolactate synthase n=1 Tax=Limosilactobacillus gastricus DSM 16045 TaxID=1423749 RepID=A0A0R1V948_9LACO|nr:biosynthetic-type acetolactate synthase large subunit [Limosilactobacillus gastricus]KRM02010.1 acetolactate synthase [Limosilactobacillus gastricus DSM 16045]QGF39946.1 biosynthetic-type acetolactate synthase large subunit [Limosilactobacillus gastricus]
MNKTSGSKALLDELTAQQVEVVFGYPGGAVIPLYDEVYQEKYHNILVRHEQGAAHAAEGYAKASGKTGVVFTTSGPGATNALTGVADAKLDSVPMVVFTGQVGRALIGTDAFQEVDIVSMAKAVTKATFQVLTPSELVPTVRKAFQIAQDGRPGPVLVDLPKDITTADVYLPSRPAPVSETLPDDNQVQFQEVWETFKKAKKPLLLVGNGAAKEETSRLVREFVTQTQTPTVATLLGLGVLPSNDPNFLGMGGMHGSYAANQALSNCDFLLNLGSRFDDRLATKPSEFASQATIAHFDLDPHELGKIITTDYPVVTDAKVAMEWFVNASQSEPTDDHTAWLAQVQSWQSEHPFTYQKETGVMKPQAVIEAVSQATHGQAYVATDVGQHQMWVSQYYQFQQPSHLVTSGGLGTMGFGIPGAIGAKLAHPDQDVVLFLGDGGFQMTSEELDVIRENQLNVKVVMFNNHALGMVKQWQDLFFDQHRSRTVFADQPDFQKIVQGYGLDTYRLSPDNWQAELENALASSRAAFIEVEIPADENVFPMIPAGEANTNMLLG